ncbi:gas vesicle protein GvpJ [Nonomuraea jiangxiensis]|uniref:Gas vesicle protein A n=1 Tax=Nonomuraea jiangxiensis TaxID=633440 RepID=A0A1G8FLU3_9ACTN|nr:gas vesicle protein GvpJ [Nonomuraea jiangxiensis]SDH83078.1 Gas vesicle protein [Nonomuraea jiangxiensis]
MSTSVQPAATGQMAGRPSPTGLADVIDTILDKGLVIDAYVRVSLVGIEILTIDTRIVVASVDTYLRFAEAANRLDMAQTGEKGLPDVLAQAKGASGLGQKQAAGLEPEKDVIQGQVERADELTDFTDEAAEPRRRERAPRRRRPEEE